MTAGAEPGAAADPTRVVVLDEHPDAAHTVATVLDGAGFTAATTGALDVAADSVRHEGVAVVVVGTGTDEVRDLRAEPGAALADVSVVAIVDDARAADAALTAGADSVLIRPVEAARLVEAVGEVAASDAAVRRARRRDR